MKRCLCIILCSIITWHSIAQIVNPYVAQTVADFCTQWNVLEYRPEAGTGGISEATTYIFAAAGDTTIAATTYTRIVRYPSFAPDSKEYICAIRTQKDSVLVHYNHFDYLLYDFGAKVGDERNIFAGINNVTGTYKNIVTGISVMPDGKKKITVDIQKGENIKQNCEWIEGVGSTQGLLYTGGSGLPGSYGYELLCASHEDLYLYRNGNEPFASLGCVYNTASSTTYLSGLCQTFYTKAHACGGYTTVPDCSFDTDTLIQGKHYVCVIPPVMYETRLFLHQEGRRIYARPEYQQEEFLLFDFSLNVGDTVPYLYRYYDYPSGHWHFKYRTPDDWVYIDENIPADTVVSVSETTLQNGETRRMYRTSQKQIFVEGFGTLAKGLFGTLSSGEEACGTEFGLLCCSRNDAPLYTMSEASFRRLGLQGDECRCFETPVLDALEQVGALQLSVSPNPVHDYLELQGLGKEAAVAIYDLSGQCLLRTASRRIDVSDLSQGIYLLQAVTTDGLHCQTKFLKE